MNCGIEWWNGFAALCARNSGLESCVFGQQYVDLCSFNWCKANRVPIAVLPIVLCHFVIHGFSAISWFMALVPFCDILVFSHFAILWYTWLYTLLLLWLVSHSIAHLADTIWPMVWQPEIFDTQCQFTRLSSPVNLYRLLGKTKNKS